MRPVATPPRERSGWLAFAARVGLIIGLIVGAGWTLASCFSPREPPCAFSCMQPPQRCPPNYTCGADGYCHRVGATSACDFENPHDAGGDANSAPAEAGTD